MHTYVRTYIPPTGQHYEESRKPVVRDNAEKASQTDLQHTHHIVLDVQEYLAKLEAIRRQNYQERKRIQQRVAMGNILDSKVFSLSQACIHTR